MPHGLSRRAVLAVGVLAACVWVATVSGVAVASGGGVVWSIASRAVPSDFSTAQNGGCSGNHNGFLSADQFCDAFVVTATDAGSGAASSAPVRIVDQLPAGVTVQDVSLLWSKLRRLAGHSYAEELPFCSQAPGSPGVLVTCSIPTKYFVETIGRTVAPDDYLKLLVFVTVDEPSSPGLLPNAVSVEGAGAPKVSASAQNTVAMGPPGFGPGSFSAPFLTGQDNPLTGEAAFETQAGGHPYELPVTLGLNTADRDGPEGFTKPTSVQDLRDVIVDLPLGLVGSAVSTPTCTLHQLSTEAKVHEPGIFKSSCPEDTIVGFLESFPEAFVSVSSPLYNIVPEKGVPAEFGYVDTLDNTHVLYASIAPTPEGYVLRSTTKEIPQVEVDEATADIYGDPAARDRSPEAPVPMFTMPADCTGAPLRTKVYLDSWQNPARIEPNGVPVNLEEPAWAKAESESAAVTGCEALAGLFTPKLEASVESTQADSPTGVGVKIVLPSSEGTESPGVPPVKETILRFPAGMTVNPSAANGLQACSEAQIGWLGETLTNFSQAAPECPEASRVGTIEVESPALPAEACKQFGESLSECPAEAEREKTPLVGSIYLARQSENPFGKLLALYIVIDDPRTGVIVKIPAKLEAEEATGQLTATVSDTPQFPFTVLRTRTFGGATGSLSTPAACGAYQVASLLTPWSATGSEPPASLSSSFNVSEAAGGGPCPTSPTLPFAPSLTAGVSSGQAAGFTPFSLTFSRTDAEQAFGLVSVTNPQGLSGILKNVVQCPEPQASKGECPPESEIGQATSAVGTGPDPYWVHGGKVFLTGPYDDGPFGLSIVIPTTAGPFTLTGNAGYGREVVRSSIRVNPNTAQVTVASDPLPLIIEGIPTDIKTVNVTIDHQDFLFNPTNCEPQTINAAFTGVQGAGATQTTPFHTTGCGALPFAPKLTATAAAQGSKLGGTRFVVNVTSAGLGQANIHKVDLTIPAVLPSRLETIQKACPDQTFNTNPAGCAEGSVIGEGIVNTPILAHPLRGPVYLVSHAAEAFPDVEFVLQGEGVTIILDGKTDIKNKVTYSKFETAPDAPFTSFESIFPAGPHSALTTHVPEREFYNICHQPRITMPTEITGQNDAQIKQTTIIQVQGCPTHPSITSHKTKNHTLTLTIYLPAAGRLTITGKGIHTTTSTSISRETLTLKTRINPHHPNTTQLHITYTPQTGPKQTQHQKLKL
jgi:hypothetical protein